jgi:CRISPR system Cascade subunit CasD
MSTGKANTLFLRLEGLLQAWGENSKLIMRRTLEAPTKSGVLGMVCCAMGVPRLDARPVLGRLNRLQMGVRIDRPGTLSCDYHTVGAGFGMITAEGKHKTGAQGTLVTRRYYLCDASFVVALQGDADLIAEVAERFRQPVWPVHLGRKSCPPSRPLVTRDDSTDLGTFADLMSALKSKEWVPRLERDWKGTKIDLVCLVEWRAVSDSDVAPADAEVWHDTPVSFDPPVHQPRLVIRHTLSVEVSKDPLQKRTPEPPRPRANYQNKEYHKVRDRRLQEDHYLCVFCKAPLVGKGRTVQHITYRHAGGDERVEELRSLCRLCHDAVTMIVYGLGMGLDRINPEEPRWRDTIIRKRHEIIQFRSLETRRRRLEPEEVE